MADRYWVGGTGNWSDTARWSTASGGSSGASVPTSADNVFFDNNSAAGTFTVTIDTATAVCGAFDASGITNAARKMTLTGTASVGIITVNGNWTNPTSTYFAWTAWTAGTVVFAATGTITTNAVAFNASLSINGSGITVTLGGAFSSTSGNYVLVNGTFDTSSANNYSFTNAGAITISANSNTKVLNWNASAVSTSNATCFSNLSTGGFTFNAGTSTFTCSNASPTLAGGGVTFHNVTFSSTAGGTVTVTGANTFSGTLSQASRGGTSFRIIQFGADQTIGTLTLGTANTVIRRIFCISNTIGTQRTLTVTTFTSTTDVDFRDIQAAGSSVSSSNWNSTGTGRFGDCGGNGNKITFDTAKTVYWNLAAGGNWSDTAWATTTGSGAAVATNNFPLAQDTAIIQSDTATLGASNTITFDVNWNVGSVNLSSRTSNAMTLAFGAATLTGLYGDFNVGSGVTVTSTSGALLFAKQGGAQTFTYSPAAAFPKSITQNGPTGTVQIANNTTLDTTFTYTLTAGTLDLTNNGAGNYTLSTGLFSSSNSNTRAITFGTGNITLTGSGTTIWSLGTATGFSVSGTPTVNCTYSGSTGTRTITNTITLLEAQTLNFNISAGSDIVTIGTCRSLNFTGFSGTLSNFARYLYGNLIFSSGMTIEGGVNTTSFYSSSGVQQITTNGNVIDFPINLGTATTTNTLQLQDNLTMGSTRTFTHTSGTLDLNTKTATINTFSSTGTGTRAISFGTTGKLAISGSSTSAFTASGSGLTTSGTGTISMTSASAKTFAGGGFSYPKLAQDGAGTLTITGSNTFYDITNSVQPTTVTFTAGTTTSVNNFSLSGTAGNLVTINSSTPGSQFTLTKL